MHFVINVFVRYKRVSSQNNNNNKKKTFRKRLAHRMDVPQQCTRNFASARILH